MRRSWPLDAKGMAMVFRSSDAAAGRGESKCMLYELYRFFFAQTQSEKLHNHSRTSLYKSDPPPRTAPVTHSVGIRWTIGVARQIASSPSHAPTHSLSLTILYVVVFGQKIQREGHVTRGRKHAMRTI